MKNKIDVIKVFVDKQNASDDRYTIVELNYQDGDFVEKGEIIGCVETSKADIEGFSDFVRTIKGVEVSMMIMENEDQSCRLNFRSTGKYIIIYYKVFQVLI